MLPNKLYQKKTPEKATTSIGPKTIPAIEMDSEEESSTNSDTNEPLVPNKRNASFSPDELNPPIKALKDSNNSSNSQFTYQSRATKKKNPKTKR